MVKSDDDFYALTMRQQLNVIEQLSRFRKEIEAVQGGVASELAVADIARDPLRKYDSGYSIGATSTLWTNCSHLWLLPGPSLTSSLGRYGRRLSRGEKARIAGLVPSSLIDLSAEQFNTAIGNTIPVPLVGAVMFPLLRAWVELQCVSPF